jgi:tetratricopeptide (TPR) repeat protein
MPEPPRVRFVCVILVVMVAAVFSGALNCGFVDYDDHVYVVSNPEVQHGLTGRSLEWAFTTGAASNWHPLTWLSHTFDVALYGLKPAGHHLTSLALHAANSVLLLLVLLRMTGAFWRSAFVAAMFALHPLRVESVVWVSERKDVLSGFFWLWSVWAYARYAAGETKVKYFYEVSVFCFALGLMAKPMVVTLPFLLLLLDFWPLGRQKEGVGKLLVEKIPFFILAAGSSVVTYLVQQKGGSVSYVLPLGGRLANAAVSYARYLGKTFWPVNLSVLYPHPGHWPAGEVVAAVVFLAVMTGLVAWRAGKQPYLVVGWFWFLGMLVPAIGLVQVGLQSMADRYTYLPLTGIFIMVAWGANDWLGGWRFGRWMLGILGGGAVVACAALTVRQTGYWRDTQTLFTHAVKVTERNYLAYNNLGYFLSNQGKSAEAMGYFQSSLAINPDYEEARNNLGFALAGQGRYQEAAEQYQAALRINPRLTEAHNNLGIALAALGRGAEAMREYQTALEENPRHAEAHNNYGIALALAGRMAEAMEQFIQAIADKEDYAGAHSNLGNALAMQGKLEEAAREFGISLRLEPRDSQAHNNLGNVRVQQGKFEEAAGQYKMALALKPENPEAHFNLGYCLEKAGQRAEAEAEYEMALRQRPDYPAAKQRLEALKKGQQWRP